MTAETATVIPAGSHQYGRVLPAERKAGVGIHIASLPGPHGIGDIGDAAHAFVGDLADMHIGVWQFLPTGPTAFGDSPYQSLSAFAGNEMLIGVEPLLRAGLVEPGESGALGDLPEHFVDYGRLIPAKQALLAKAARRFLEQGGGDLGREYEGFLARHDDAWLDDYALFRVIKSMHGERAWPEWEPRYVHRDAGALHEIRTASWSGIEQIKVQQFFFDRQWRDLREHAARSGVILFADMPIYIALDSADAWARPEILRIDADGRPSHVSGVPPDYFSEDGQLWGNPLYDWGYHAASGFRWWIGRLRHAADMADLVRIDHFRGFESYWSVPAGSGTARNGAWEPGPGEALFDALQAALGHLPIVAEDLGVITPEVEELRRRLRIPGMAVLQFDIGEPGFEPGEIGEHCVCYTGTHDNDTTLGWFKGGNDDTRTPREVEKARANALRLTGGRPETIHIDMIRLAFATRAGVAVAPMQDFLGLGSEARLNIPGTTAGNWRWRLLPGQLTPRLRDSVRNMIREAARG